MSEIAHPVSELTIARNFPLVLLRQGFKHHGPQLGVESGLEEVKGGPGCFGGVGGFLLPSHTQLQNHGSGQSRLLLSTKGALELSRRASQGQLTSPHCKVRGRTEQEAASRVKPPPPLFLFLPPSQPFHRNSFQSQSFLPPQHNI